MSVLIKIAKQLHIPQRKGESGGLACRFPTLAAELLHTALTFLPASMAASNTLLDLRWAALAVITRYTRVLQILI